MIIPDAERSVLREGDVELSGVLLFEKSGEGGESGEVLYRGTYEEDGPVIWEVLASPREIPVERRAGHPSPELARPQAHVLVARLFGRTSVCPTR
jgi:hypothetical protein